MAVHSRRAFSSHLPVEDGGGDSRPCAVSMCRRFCILCILDIPVPASPHLRVPRGYSPIPPLHLVHRIAIPYTQLTMIHDNLPRAIAELEARMTNIRDSL